MGEAYLVAAVRTAGGRRNGRLRDWHPADLGGQVIDAVVARAAIDPALIDDVIFGCVGQVGQQSNNVARGAVLSSGLPERVPATTVDRQCGSSQQAIHFAAQAVMSGTMDMVLAGGVESMSRVPMMLASSLPAEHGFGSPKSAGMEARYPGVPYDQFSGAELIAERFALSRETLEAFSVESHRRAAQATMAGAFADEILPIPVSGAGGAELHLADEGIRYDATAEAMAQLATIRPGGRHTAASASQICDGAAAMLVVNERGLKASGLTPLARIHQLTVLGGDPVAMLDVPLAATALALKRAGMRIDDIDLYEVNEAFASVPLAWLQDTGADPARLNVNGGAIALGHPLGGSGAKLMTTLVHALRARGGRYGLQAMCEGGGMANVTIIERL